MPPAQSASASAGMGRPRRSPVAQSLAHRLPGLFCGAHEDLVDGYPAVAGDHVDHRVGDVLGPQLHHACGLPVERIAALWRQVVESISVSTVPGPTTPTRTRLPSTSWRRASLNALTPNFVSE